MFGITTEISSRTISQACRYRCWAWLAIPLAAWIAVSFSAYPSLGQDRERPRREILLEVFTRSDSEPSREAAKYASALAARTPGLRVEVHDVLEDNEQLSRLWKLAKSAGRDKPVVPAFRSCDRMYFGFSGAEQTGPQVEDLFTAHVYTRATCPRCKNAKAFLARFQQRWPAMRVKIYEITQDAAARRRWQELCNQHRVVPGLPTMAFAGRLIVGYQGDAITGRQYEDLLIQVSGSKRGSQPAGRDTGWLSPLPAFPVGMIAILQLPTEPVSESPETFDAVPPPDDFDAVPLPEEAKSEDFDTVPLPDGAAPEQPGEQAVISGEEGSSESAASYETIVVPWLGELNVRELGLPIFTFLVGLVDGFNPCAMWVLVFLLSILVNIKDRKKIIFIAGTFVVVSGLAYYTFMAAWLSLLLIGLARWIQVTLGVMAIIIGVINVKDFFAFKKGISLSIPESSKPGIYARVRHIVTTEYLTVALMGAVVLAVLVNVVELLCTAGLPALYTQILTMHELPAWKNYLYLALYISAYMLDDTILLVIVVVTLSHRRLQEREGRWLKLISGLVILILGAVMILKPEWMQLGG